MSEPWHRWFGLTWMDLFYQTPVVVEPEKDTSVQQQLLDVLVLRPGPMPADRPLPDGFGDMAAHNLITFKSHHEPMDEWALLELLNHFVAYRKFASPSTSDLLPWDAFRLYAVSVRSPEGLSSRVTLRPVGTGVYDGPVLNLTIRLVVVRELPREARHAMFCLFGGDHELIRFGYENYRFHSPGIEAMLSDVFRAYLEEGTIMADALQEYIREATARILAEMPVEQRLEGVPVKDIVAALPVEELIAALPPELREQLRRGKDAG